jgi:hypothetical protein
MERARSFLQSVLLIVFGWFSLDLLLHAFFEHETRWMRGAKSPLVAEGFISLAFLLLLLNGNRARPVSSGTSTRTRGGWPGTVPALLVGLCLASFAWSLSTPLLYDDYGHVTFASGASFRSIGDMFVRPHKDIFFRPVGFFFYFLNFKWAHWDAFRWHCWNLGVHALNCLLVYVLSIELGFSVFAAAFAGAVFAVHGSRVEPVCWTDAQFDLLVTFFVLSALLCFARYARQPRWRWLTAGFISCAPAFGAKETGFCLPACLAALLLFYSGEERQRILRLIPFVSACAVLAFLYRWGIIGGIGGYATGGHPNALNFRPILVVKALGWRIWSLAFFPINWAAGAGWWLAAGILVFLSVLILVVTKTQVELKRTLGGTALLISACLPALSVLLIGSDLAGARVLYLPFFGLALLWAAILEATAGRRTLGYAVVTGVLGFNILVLQRNVLTWREVAQKAQNVCETFGRQLSLVNRPVEVYDVPEKYLGVYFLRNAFPQCVAQNSGFPASRLSVAESASPSLSDEVKARRFRWDADAMEFRPML